MSEKPLSVPFDPYLEWGWIASWDSITGKRCSPVYDVDPGEIAINDPNVSR